MVDFSTREGIMQEWDRWREYSANGGGGSWPRDAFESLLDYYDEKLASQEAVEPDLEKMGYCLKCGIRPCDCENLFREEKDG